MVKKHYKMKYFLTFFKISAKILRVHTMGEENAEKKVFYTIFISYRI